VASIETYEDRNLTYAERERVLTARREFYARKNAGQPRPVEYWSSSYRNAGVELPSE
jgi:hypothetical protein